MSFFNISKLVGKSSSKREKKPLFLQPPFCNSTLVNGSFRRLCVLPKYIDLNEWLAVNTFDFFNHVNSFYGAIAEFCTAKDCPMMNAGSGYEYAYVDSQRKSLKLPAPQYVDYVMSSIQNALNDETLFPTKSGLEFPRTFIDTIRHIFKHLFRIFAHIYHSHFDKFVHLSMEAHLNTLFAHFVCFAREFELVEKKEYGPLQEFISELDNMGCMK